MGFVADAVEAVGGAVVDTVGKVAETVVENPMAVVAFVAAPAIAPSISAALGVSESTASIIATSSINAAGTAIQGGNIGDIIKSGAASGLGSYVGGVVGKAATDYAAANVTSLPASTVGKIAQGAAGGATAGLVATGDVGKALAGGAVGGLTAGAMEAGKSLVSGMGAGTTTPGTADTTGMPKAGETVKTSPWTSETVSPTSPYGTVGTSNQPSFSYPSSTYSPTFLESDTASKAAKLGEQYASTAVRSSLSDLLGLTPTGSANTYAPAGSTITTTGQASPGSQALAQALRVDPGATLGGGDQKAPQNVWNLASLRVKDETGG